MKKHALLFLLFLASCTSPVHTGSTMMLWKELRKAPVKLKISRTPEGTAEVEIPHISAWNAGFVEF